MLRPPVEAVIFFPFTFECVAVAGTSPEFRFFEVDGIDTRIDNPFDDHFFQVAYEVHCWYDIRHHMSMPQGIALDCYLAFIEVPFAIPFTCKVILVFAPGNTRHKMGGITTVTP